ncbi:hypothetical protein HN385_01060 [archaeon]|jgi:hypothetical protein|nr:hypothetical protein [archaeon]MBT3450602.1 hypothetical protein [archaeon]MBT6868712.1 hypothetical protein [archaeon]MBT7193500.1 hypothetical protein [archaeon]MBT7381091.1 hypothetical protein [archaeon]
MKKILILIFIGIILSTTILASNDSITVIYNPEVGTTAEDYTEAFKNNLDQIDLSEVPAIFQFLLGEPHININLVKSDETTLQFGFMVKDGKVTDFQERHYNDADYIITVEEQNLMKLSNFNDPVRGVLEMYENGDIKIQAEKFRGKVIQKISNFFI